MLKGKESWSGNASVSFSFIKNTNDIFNIVTNVAVGYNGGDNLWMIISNIRFNKIEGDTFQNSGVQHFRYNREINDRLTFEAFAQGQYDKISNIDFRGLAGFGPRFDLSKQDDETEVGNIDNADIPNKPTREKSKFYIGTLIMYEYEKSAEIDMTATHKDFRSSNYLSFSFFPTNQISIVSTTYYQPRIDLLKDYRLSSVLNLNIGFSSKKEDEKKTFWDKLNFNVNFSYEYDAFPVISIPKTQYRLTNGLSYNF